MATADSSQMAGLKRYQDFDAWKLSVKLRDEVRKLLVGRVAKDFKFCDQIRDPVASAQHCRGIRAVQAAPVRKLRSRRLRIAPRDEESPAGWQGVSGFLCVELVR
jgi:hypothetical protein